MSKKVSDCIPNRFRTPYSSFVRRDDISFVGCRSRTHQSFRNECDINQIMSRYEKTGALPEMIKANPQYGDFSELPSYQDSLHIVMKAEEQFAALSAKVRSRFDNDPSKFLDFANDPSNLDEMVELGLATKPIPESPSKAPEPPISGKTADSPSGEKSASEQA